MSKGVAIVTGGSRGIGAAICKGLAQDGYKVCVNYARSAEAASEVKAVIEAAGGVAITVQADVGDPAAVSAMASAQRSTPLTLTAVIIGWL